MAATVEFSGPYFDGRLDAAADELDGALEHDVAQQALAEWHLNLETSLRHPTGFYESHLAMRTGVGEAYATDQGVIYGHWLEGDGSRNSPRTRFPGYWSARRATAQVQGKVSDLAEGPVSRFTEKVNA